MDGSTEMKAKVKLNCEFVGNCKRFDDLFMNGDVYFVAYSNSTEKKLLSQQPKSYSIIDTTIEQGRVFAVEFEIYVYANDISDIRCMCVVAKNPHIKLLECNIKNILPDQLESGRTQGNGFKSNLF